MAKLDAGRVAHWDAVHRRQDPSEASWYETEPAVSLQILDDLSIRLEESLIDVGAGAAGMAGALLDRGFRDVTALDVSATALQKARDRLGERADQVRWIEADLLGWVSDRRFQVWHDRAVFHFLTEEPQRRRYRALLADVLTPGAAIVMATFAAKARCSAPACRFAAMTPPG